ncbi:MAG: hypothetical protein QOK44_2814 [Betaproteobacteria bacterium]|nr:hypothetical protein [Betaproteobacteria bacterium]
MTTQCRGARKTANALVCAASLVSHACWSADAPQYPTRPIRLVVPFAPGGGSDYNARLVGAHMKERLGQNVIIDNRPGAGGSTGAETVIKSTPDGYTILIISTSYLLNSILYKTSYDAVAAISPIVNIQFEPSVIVVNPKVPANSVKELIELARMKPNELTFGSAGAGSFSHLGWELFLDTYKIRMRHVPYKGTGAAITDTLAGNIDAMSGGATLMMPHVKSGRLRALGVTSPQRIALAPDIAAAAESTNPPWVRYVWHGLVGPKGMSHDAVSRINATVNEALKTVDLQERFKAQGTIPGGGTPQQFATQIRDDMKLWQEFVKRARIKLE